jgi:eukaryotic-like serine/threonine-protein kinase
MSNSAEANRNLLFGILAVQMDFISRDQLVAAMHTWVLEKHKSLGQILQAQGALAADERAILEAVVAKHIERHSNDVEQSLGSVSSVGSLHEELHRIEDSEVQASLGYVGTAHRDGRDDESTRTYIGGAPTSSNARFRILRPHARGGLGEVFVASDEELHREVALKQIQDRHALDPQSRARFLLEAEITGGLEHPGIVPVYGLGQDADGRPFYAMRFVKGDSLKEATSRFHQAERPGRDPGERSLALRGLLRRFVDVCNAAAYAHSRGVLHRDLKPGNVMLGPYGETLVVDWGSAKIVGRPGAADGAAATEPTLRPPSLSGSDPTQAGTAIGTPAYMSPEQAAGDLGRLGPHSDVYSLGATLYSLLTGRAPYEGPDIGEVLRRVQRGELSPPRQVKHAIPFPLEAICLRAMKLRPEERYDSPRELAEDIEHWLADEPVGAYREPPAARARRWLRRHRSVMTAAVAGLVVTLIGLTTLIFLQRHYNRRLEAANLAERAARDQSQKHFQLALKAVDQFYSGVSEEVLKDQPELTVLGRRLLAAPLRFYEELKDDLRRGGDQTPDARVALAHAWRSLARITSDVGSQADSLAALQQSVALVRELLHQDPENPALQLSLADGLGEVGTLLRSLGRHAESSAELNRARGILERLVADQPRAAGPRRKLANVLHNIANLQRYSNQLAETLANEESARAQEERLFADHLDGEDDLALLATIESGIGNVQRDLGNAEPAMAAYEKARAIEKRLSAEYPDSQRYRRYLSMSETNIGLLQGDLNQPDEALEYFKRARDLQRVLVSSHPNVPLYQNDLSATLHFIGLHLQRQGRITEAAATYEDSQAIAERLVTDHPNVTQYALDFGELYGHQGQLEREAGRPAAALGRYAQAIRTFEAILRREPNQGVARLFLRRVTVDRAEVLSRLGRHPEALAEWERLQVIGAVAFHEEYRRSHAMILGRANYTHRALAVARSLQQDKRIELSAGACYDLACVYSIVAGAVRRDLKLAPAERAQRLADFTNQAKLLLNRSYRAGYFGSPLHRDRLQIDPDLEALRSEPGFEELRSDLTFPADPFQGRRGER